MKLKQVSTSFAPTPGGHYTQAIVANGFAFISGQLPIDPGTGEKRTGSIEEQTLRVLGNIKAIAEASGSDLNGIVKVTVYITDIELWGQVNKVYSEFFGSHKPARTIVPVKELHYGYLIEMDAIAVVR
jgi:2-iminobutanoate/2-iminopropanoate deaminase